MYVTHLCFKIFKVGKLGIRIKDILYFKYILKIINRNLISYPYEFENIYLICFFSFIQSAQPIFVCLYFFTTNEVSIKTSLECFCCYYANQYAHVVQHDSLIIVEMKKSADQQDGMQIIHTSIKCTFIHSSVDSF